MVNLRNKYILAYTFVLSMASGTATTISDCEHQPTIGSESGVLKTLSPVSVTPSDLASQTTKQCGPSYHISVQITSVWTSETPPLPLAAGRPLSTSVAVNPLVQLTAGGIPEQFSLLHSLQSLETHTTADPTPKATTEQSADMTSCTAPTLASTQPPSPLTPLFPQTPLVHRAPASPPPCQISLHLFFNPCPVLHGTPPTPNRTSSISPGAPPNDITPTPPSGHRTMSARGASSPPPPPAPQRNDSTSPSPLSPKIASPVAGHSVSPDPNAPGDEFDTSDDGSALPTADADMLGRDAMSPAPPAPTPTPTPAGIRSAVITATTIKEACGSLAEHLKGITELAEKTSMEKRDIAIMMEHLKQLKHKTAECKTTVDVIDEFAALAVEQTDG